MKTRLFCVLVLPFALSMCIGFAQAGRPQSKTKPHAPAPLTEAHSSPDPCLWPYALLFATNLGWAFECFFLERKRVRDAKEQVSQIRQTHAAMLEQLDEILRQLRPGLLSRSQLRIAGRSSTAHGV